jgi:hypothetical protein
VPAVVAVVAVAAAPEADDEPVTDAVGGVDPEAVIDAVGGVDPEAVGEAVTDAVAEVAPEAVAEVIADADALCCVRGVEALGKAGLPRQKDNRPREAGGVIRHGMQRAEEKYAAAA